jgi:hypothetical protein
MKSSFAKADELVNYYYDEIQNQCVLSRYNILPCAEARALAINFTIKHCDEMIEFIDSEMKGWLDWDMKSYFEDVKKYAKTF